MSARNGLLPKEVIVSLSTAVRNHCTASKQSLLFRLLETVAEQKRLIARVAWISSDIIHELTSFMRRS
jgi:hypothetical protein